MSQSAVQLSRKLVLEEAARVSDGAGGFSETWSAIGTLWADVAAGSGREKPIDLLTISQVPYKIIVRGAPDGAPSRPKSDQRFREGLRVFRILAVADYDNRGQYLMCHCREEISS